MAGDKQVDCCSIESVVTIDERGQMVLPKSVREKMGIKAGDKLAVVAVSSGGRSCCCTLIRADEFSGTIKVLLKPLMDTASEEGTGD